MKTISRWAASWLTALTICACSGPPAARILDDDEGNLIGDRRAGAETFERLVGGAVDKLLGRYEPGLEAPSISRVVFAGIDNETAEELGEWRAQLTEVIDSRINRFAGFETVSMRYVGAALQETGLGTTDLMLPAKRRTFLAVLEREDNPAQCLLFATLTRGTTTSGNLTQADYDLTMELVDVATGRSIKEQQRVRKEYAR